MAYTFETLNDRDFEELCLDLLNAKYPQYNFVIGKVGRDKGIDLRYATSENLNEIVIHVKHYPKSKYANLKSKIIREELPKIKLLGTKRYCLITSLILSHDEQKELYSLLQDFVTKPDAIIDGNKLNEWLRRFPDVEKTHFKLWFSSTAVLERLINNAVYGRTEAQIHDLISKVNLFVQTKSFTDALDIISKKRVLLITGVPGVGKTTLAEMVLLKMMHDGCQPVCVDKIAEVEQMISVSNEQRQVFLFDDFLGSNYLSLQSGLSDETPIARVIKRISNSKNSYFILTTRTVIYNQAINISEKIGRELPDYKKFEVKIEDYTLLDKARILYNHIQYHTCPKRIVNELRFLAKVQ